MIVKMRPAEIYFKVTVCILLVFCSEGTHHLAWATGLKGTLIFSRDLLDASIQINQNLSKVMSNSELKNDQKKKILLEHSQFFPGLEHQLSEDFSLRFDFTDLTSVFLQKASRFSRLKKLIQSPVGQSYPRLHPYLSDLIKLTGQCELGLRIELLCVLLLLEKNWKMVFPSWIELSQSSEGQEDLVSQEIYALLFFQLQKPAQDRLKSIQFRLGKIPRFPDISLVFSKTGQLSKTLKERFKKQENDLELNEKIIFDPLDDDKFGLDPIFKRNILTSALECFFYSIEGKLLNQWIEMREKFKDQSFPPLRTSVETLKVVSEYLVFSNLHQHLVDSYHESLRSSILLLSQFIRVHKHEQEMKKRESQIFHSIFKENKLESLLAEALVSWKEERSLCRRVNEFIQEENQEVFVCKGEEFSVRDFQWVFVVSGLEECFLGGYHSLIRVRSLIAQLVELLSSSADYCQNQSDKILKTNSDKMTSSPEEGEEEEKNLDLSEEEFVFQEGFNPVDSQECIQNQELALEKSAITHGKRTRELFELLFNDKENHLKISFDDLKTLAKRFEGKIDMRHGGSHCRLILPGGSASSYRPHVGGSSRLPRHVVKRMRSIKDMGHYFEGL